MGGSVITPLNAAMHAKAIDDPVLMGMVTGVHQFVPEGAAFPYIEFGFGVESPDNTHDSFGSATTVIWHVWDRSRNPDTAHNIANRVAGLFDHQALTIAGHRLVAVRREQVLTVADPDPEIRHVTIRFAVTTTETT